MKDYILNFELVPEGCWYSNLRSILAPKDWDVIRKAAYAQANGKCMICGAPQKRLEAHERWSYDDEKHIQKLQSVIAVCRRCHEVIHIGRTQLTGRGTEAMEHFMRVNGCSQSEFHLALGQANTVHRERSRHEWNTDISLVQALLKNAK